MQIAKTVEEVRSVRWAQPGLSWGLVPTMGALHDGHLSLVQRARAENERVGVSIFVNPIQFDRHSDLEAYPRDFERDYEMLAMEGVDLVWAPSESEVYPPGFQTYVTVEEIATLLEGASRPGHFRGVATVVVKLFNVFQPARAYFGQKDAQQVALIRQMVRDLAFNLAIVVCPIVREPDGLAMSSRNTRLDTGEWEAALVLSQALRAAQQEWTTGHRDADHLRETMKQVIAANPLARVDYVSVADLTTLREIKGDTSRALLSMAVFIGDVRLIDNLVVGDQEHS